MCALSYIHIQPLAMVTCDYTLHLNLIDYGQRILYDIVLLQVRYAC